MLYIKKFFLIIGLLMMMSLSGYGAFLMWNQKADESQSFAFWLSLVFSFMLFGKWTELDHKIQIQKEKNKKSILKREVGEKK